MNRSRFAGFARFSGFARFVIACTVAIGALSPVPSALSPARAQSPTVTFSKDVAPIVYAHCVSCHRPGEIGPFSLLTYSDARQHATQIAELTARRAMPPWKPERGSETFIGDRSLSDEQIAVIEQWVAQGAVEGSAADLPPAPRASDGWQLGTPDVVVTMAAPYVLRADGSDAFRTFVIPIPTSKARYVKAIEFRPGNARAVHHANLGIDHTGSSRRLDGRDGQPGYVGGMVPDAAYPPGYMLGWTPGQRPRPSPDGMPWRLEPASDLVVQLHMQPTGKPESIQPSAALYFTDEPPVRTPVGLRLGSETIDIPAGDPSYIVTDKYVLPVDAELLGVQPHAHNLARRMEADATLPDRTKRSLITITDWDFRWQDVYRYEHPIALPRGTVLSMRYTYDNSTANPRNPVRPPQHVVWGQNTSDEMGDLWMQLVPASQKDFSTLAEDIAKKTRAEDIAAYTKLLNGDPLNPLRHDTVGMLSLQAGLTDQAITHFRNSLRLNPASAPTQYNLGMALSYQRNYPEATNAFREAVRIDPNYADAHNNLGALLTLTGQFDEAEAHYRQALALRNDYADAHSNLARILWMKGQSAQALEEFRRAAELKPDSPAALAGLAWVRAAAVDPAFRNGREAVQLAERAADLTGRNDPAVLDILAAAYAEAGDFERAIPTAEAAWKMSLGPAKPPILERLDLYRQHVAFHEPAHPKP